MEVRDVILRLSQDSGLGGVALNECETVLRDGGVHLRHLR